MNPDSRDGGAGGNCDSSVGINGNGDISSAVETQVETWRNSAAAAERADDQIHRQKRDMLADGAGVRFVPGHGASMLQAATPSVKVTLSSLQEQEENEDEGVDMDDEDDDRDVLATPASLLPMPSDSPPPKLTPMQDRVADWPDADKTWPNNTRACMNWLT